MAQPNSDDTVIEDGDEALDTEELLLGGQKKLVVVGHDPASSLWPDSQLGSYTTFLE